MARSGSQSPLPATTGTTTATITLTLNNSSESSSSSSEQLQQHPTETLTLKLKPKKKSVSWKQGTVDNEFLNKKSSKICCIFHKEKPFDEDDSDGDENENQSVKKDHHCYKSEDSGEASTSNRGDDWSPLDFLKQ